MSLILLKSFVKRFKMKKRYDISCIKGDHSGDFENHDFKFFCNNFGIGHKFSSPRTLQQTGVIERKNRPIQEMDIPMLNKNALLK